MDQLATEMMEYICDSICHYPHILNAEELENKCADCKMGQYVCDILDHHNKCKEICKGCIG